MLTNNAPKLAIMIIFQIACLKLIFTYSDSLLNFSTLNYRLLKLAIGIGAFAFFAYQEIQLANNHD